MGTKLKFWICTSLWEMSQRQNYYEDEIDDAEDYEEVGLNLAIGNYGQAGIYEDGSQSIVQSATLTQLN